MRRPWPALGRTATEKNLWYCLVWCLSEQTASDTILPLFSSDTPSIAYVWTVPTIIQGVHFTASLRTAAVTRRPSWCRLSMPHSYRVQGQGKRDILCNTSFTSLGTGSAVIRLPGWVAHVRDRGSVANSAGGDVIRRSSVAVSRRHRWYQFGLRGQWFQERRASLIRDLPDSAHPQVSAPCRAVQRPATAHLLLALWQTDRRTNWNAALTDAARYLEQRRYVQIESKDSQVKTQLVLWIFILWRRNCSPYW